MVAFPNDEISDPGSLNAKDEFKLSSHWLMLFLDCFHWSKQTSISTLTSDELTQFNIPIDIQTSDRVGKVIPAHSW